MKTLENASEFKTFDMARSQGDGLPSIWVSKGSFTGMASDRFVGKFKIRNYSHNGETKTSEIIDKKVKSFPCKAVIHMASNKRGEKVFVKVTLLDCGVIDDRHIGIVISGIV